MRTLARGRGRRRRRVCELLLGFGCGRRGRLRSERILGALQVVQHQVVRH